MNVLSLFDGQYEVSDCGKVFSNKRKQKKELIGAVKDSGYREVLLTVCGVRRYFLVHRLVASAFINNDKNKRTVNHIDGNKLNNKITNLEWATDSENLKHARDNGLTAKKLTPEIARNIKLAVGTHRGIAKEYGVSKTLVGYIKLGRRWS